MSNFSLDPSKDNYCVMGNPVVHSKSPQLHAAFATQTKQNIHYQSILVEEGNFAISLEQFQQQGGMGLNITVPFKGDAWQASQAFSTERANTAQAVNTIWFGSEGECHGDNTDGIGLVRDLTINHQVTLTEKNILILGAGGAVRGIIEPLLGQQPVEIAIANRTLAKADKLKDIFSDRNIINVCSYGELSGKKFDLIINGTSASLQNEVPPLPDDLSVADACCYDMMYSNNDTAFVTWAKAHNAAKTVDGLGMLVEQAAESFYIWRGIKPDTQPVIKELRNQL